MDYNPVELAIKAAGSASALARKVGVSHQAICRWKKNRAIPLSKVQIVAKTTSIPKRILNPAFE